MTADIRLSYSRRTVETTTYQVNRQQQSRSKRIDWRIAQPQVGEAAFFPQTKQRPVERKAQGVIAALNRDADTLAEIPALQERSATERATGRGIGAVDPERKRQAVAEQEVHFVLAQRSARGLGIR